MLEFQKEQNSFKLSWNGICFLKHSFHDSALEVGEGIGHYKERHGSFRIRNIFVRGMRKLKTFDVLEQRNEKIVVCFENILTLVAEIVNNRLELRFSTADTRLNRMILHLCAQPDIKKFENIYGCGEQYSHLNLKGRKVPLWCEEQGIGRSWDLISILSEIFYGAAGRWYTTYFPQPTFVSSQGYFVHSHSTAYAEFDFRKKQTHSLLFWEIPHRITIDAQKSLPKVLTSLTSLLGRQPRLPEWTFSGAWLGIQGGLQVIQERLKQVKEENTPVAAVWAQDWEGVRVTPFGRQLWWNWQHDAERYPNIKQQCENFANDGIRFLGYINPFLALEKDLYKIAHEQNLLIKKNDGTEAYVLVTSFPAAMLDLTNPDTKIWIKDIIKTNMIGCGLSGWMADFGEWAPPKNISLYSKEDPEKHHNAYPVLWAQLNREAIEESGRGNDIPFFTRAGYSGTSRFSPIIWAGDQLVNWSKDDGLASVIPAALSLGYSGIGVTHSDIGGYTTVAWIKRSKELFMRWAEMAAFSPIFRTHEGNRPNSNWQFHSDSETLKHFARMARIHASLKNYVAEALEEYYKHGIPLQRHVAMHYENDPTAHNLQYQYLYGRDIIVAPVYIRGKKSWRVYLPNDVWIHFWSGVEFKSGWHTVAAPLGEPPVFWKKYSSWNDTFYKISQQEHP